MKTFKISRSTNEVVTTEKLDYEYIVSSGNGLCLVVKEENGVELSVGGKIRFEKSASGNSGQMLSVSQKDAVISNIVLKDGYKYIYFEYLYIVPLTIANFLRIESDETPYRFKFYFTSEHYMVPGDFEKYEDELPKKYTLYVRRGNMIMRYDDLALCFPGELVKGESTSSEETETKCTPGEERPFNYETMERNSILAMTSTCVSSPEFVPVAGDVVLLCTNPYFFTNASGQVVCYDNVEVRKYTDFMNVGVVLEQDYDAKRMYQEYQVNDLFVKKIKSSIIPDFIDLEKVKFAPAHGEELATGLTFNLHFRTRQSGETKYDFADTWYIEEGSSGWNTDNPETPADISELADDYTSNLMGFLGFTDDDIYNQKNKVKRSFLRLSFYDSDNPLTQQLLYYSTIFLDSGELYGKFVKRKAWLEDNGYDTEETPVVWSPFGLTTGDTEEPEAVTSQITVNDEYDTTKSGEGFNLYLFKEDAPVDESGYSVYMKVEFNHAGYGRTIPLMLIWSSGLTIENYLQNIYIKVNVSLTEDGYVYAPEGVEWENERLIFNLFEPMIEEPEN